MDLIGRYRGEPAAYVEVFRTADEKVLEIVAAVEAHLEEEVIPSLPAGVGLEIWNNDADILQSRLGLLVKNGFLGLALVLLALAIFLEIRLAFWVAVGIAVSFVGTFAVMSVLGVSINLMSLFAFILAIGIVVDDAIVVGENIYAERERGAKGVVASIRGTRRITRPVIFAVLTTVVAFCPLFFIPSSIGRIIGEIPIIVMSVLLFSLLESLLVLPNHLSHLPDRSGRPTRHKPHLIGRIQSRVESGLQRFIAGPLDRSLRFATGRPGIVIASGIAMIIVCVAMIPAGIIKVDFMPSVEGDLITASLEMPEGTPVQRTTDVARTWRRPVTGRSNGSRPARARKSTPSSQGSTSPSACRRGSPGPAARRLMPPARNPTSRPSNSSSSAQRIGPCPRSTSSRHGVRRWACCPRPSRSASRRNSSTSEPRFTSNSRIRTPPGWP